MRSIPTADLSSSISQSSMAPRLRSQPSRQGRWFQVRGCCLCWMMRVCLRWPACWVSAWRNWSIRQTWSLRTQALMSMASTTMKSWVLSKSRLKRAMTISTAARINGFSTLALIRSTTTSCLARSTAQLICSLPFLWAAFSIASSHRTPSRKAWSRNGRRLLMTADICAFGKTTFWSPKARVMCLRM